MNLHRCYPGRISNALHYHYANPPQVRRAGLEPTMPEGDGFTDRCATNCTHRPIAPATGNDPAISTLTGWRLYLLSPRAHSTRRKREESNPLGCYTPLFSRQLPTVRRRFQTHSTERSRTSTKPLQRRLPYQLGDCRFPMMDSNHQLLSQSEACYHYTNREHPQNRIRTCIFDINSIAPYQLGYLGRCPVVELNHRLILIRNVLLPPELTGRMPVQVASASRPESNRTDLLEGDCSTRELFVSTCHESTGKLQGRDLNSRAPDPKSGEVATPQPRNKQTGRDSNSQPSHLEGDALPIELPEYPDYI